MAGTLTAGVAPKRGPTVAQPVESLREWACIVLEEGISEKSSSSSSSWTVPGELNDRPTLKGNPPVPLAKTGDFRGDVETAPELLLLKRYDKMGEVGEVETGWPEAVEIGVRRGGENSSLEDSEPER